MSKRENITIEIDGVKHHIHEECYADTLGECEKKYNELKRIYGHAACSIVPEVNYFMKPAPRFTIHGYTIGNDRIRKRV